jgi:hypothetical protein
MISKNLIKIILDSLVKDIVLITENGMCFSDYLFYIPCKNSYCVYDTYFKIEDVRLIEIGVERRACIMLKDRRM